MAFPALTMKLGEFPIFETVIYSIDEADLFLEAKTS